jgi:hypothetical protein
MKIQHIILFVIVAPFLASLSNAQDAKPDATEPKTKIGAFESRTGSVLIKGFSDVGAVTGSGRVAIELREFTDAASGRKEYGVVIEVKGSDRLDRETRALIDYDELDGLLKGIDYVRKIDRTVTKLTDFEAIYRTRDGVKITVFNSSSGKIESAVETGHYAGSSAFLSIQKLDELRALLATAKTKIEALKKG